MARVTDDDRFLLLQIREDCYFLADVADLYGNNVNLVLEIRPSSPEFDFSMAKQRMNCLKARKQVLWSFTSEVADTLVW